MNFRNLSSPTVALATAAVAGCLIVVLADFSMWFIVDGYNPLQGSISDLGAGPYHMILDIGIAAYALGILCLAGTTFTRQSPENGPWPLRLVLLGLSSVIILIAFWNEYGDGQPGGLEIHKYLLVALYLLVAVTIWLTRDLALKLDGGGGNFSPIILIIWLIAAPSLRLMPDAIYGGYERLLGLTMVGVVAANAWWLIREASDD